MIVVNREDIRVMKKGERSGYVRLFREEASGTEREQSHRCLLALGEKPKETDSYR
jgi:hypothetical protein